MKIVCLGWGSLVWDPRELLIKGEWLTDGPPIPVEFLRKSSDGRITLVLNSNAKFVPSLWCEMDTEDLEAAKWSLGKREYENATPGWISKNIGVWTKGEDAPNLIPSLSVWAQNNDIDAVLWTALPCKHPLTSQDVVASEDEIIKYIKSVDKQVLESIRKYVNNAPTQIETEYRQAIEKVIDVESQF